MSRRLSLRAAPAAALLALAACSGGGGSSPGPAASSPPVSPTSTPTVTPTTAPTSTPTVEPTATPVSSAAPQMVFMNFKYTSATSSYGSLAFYAATPAATSAQPISEVAGSKIVFANSDTSVHTASGLGSTGFPASFDNVSGPTATGSAIDGGTTWSTGAVSPGGTSSAFTVGAPGTYYFGCYYHYSFGMEDVIVSKSS